MFLIAVPRSVILYFIYCYFNIIVFIIITGTYKHNTETINLLSANVKYINMPSCYAHF